VSDLQTALAVALGHHALLEPPFYCKLARMRTFLIGSEAFCCQRRSFGQEKGHWENVTTLRNQKLLTLRKAEGHRTPIQARARDSMEKLINTTMDMLIESGYHEFNLKELSKRSGVSIGSLYHRFKNKQALVQEVQRRVYQESLSDHDRIIAKLRALDLPLSKLVPRLVKEFAAHTRHYSAVLRVFMYIATEDPEVGRIGSEKFTTVRDGYVSVLIERHEEIVRKNPNHAARACFEMIYSCLSRRLGLIAPAADLNAREWKQFIEDVALMATLYLTSER